MWVTTKAVYQMNDAGDYELVSMDGYDYEGPIAHCGGGPSRAQNDAASAQAAASNQASANSREMMDFQKQQMGLITPFATNRMQNGLPFYNSLTDSTNGTTAQAFKPAYAALNQRMSTQGALPNGFGQQMTGDLDAQRARAFDSGLVGNMVMNDNAKTNAAGMLTGQESLANPLGWSGNAMQGNSSIMNAPLAKPGIGGMLGGIAGGAMSAIPF